MKSATFSIAAAALLMASPFMVSAQDTTTNCAQTYTVVAGDTCSTVATEYGLTEQELYKLNPKLHHTTAHLCDNFDVGKAYCVCEKQPCPKASGSSIANTSGSTSAFSNTNPSTTGVSVSGTTVPGTVGSTTLPVAASQNNTSSGKASGSPTHSSDANHTTTSLAMIAVAGIAAALIAL